MSRTLPSAVSTGAALDHSRPFWLVEFGYGTPIRLSSRGQMTLDGDVFSAAGLDRVRINVKEQTGSLQIVNDGSYTFSGGAGISSAVYVGYGDDVTARADVEQIQDGELGSISTRNNVILIRVIPHRPRFCPRVVARPPTFNHLPPSGTEIVTPNGVYVLERAS